MRAETGVTSIFAGDETPSDTRSADGSRTRTEDDQIPSAGRELHVDQGLVLDVRQQATVTQPVEPGRHTRGPVEREQEAHRRRGERLLLVF